jgi:hypothetical protein
MASRRLIGLATVGLRRCGAFSVARPRAFNGLGLAARANAARCFSSGKPAAPSPALTYTAVEEGTLGTDDYKILFKNVSGKIISPWHDIPLENGNYCNFICEVLM